MSDSSQLTVTALTSEFRFGIGAATVCARSCAFGSEMANHPLPPIHITLSEGSCLLQAFLFWAKGESLGARLRQTPRRLDVGISLPQPAEDRQAMNFRVQLVPSQNDQVYRSSRMPFSRTSMPSFRSAICLFLMSDSLFC